MSGIKAIKIGLSVLLLGLCQNLLADNGIVDVQDKKGNHVYFPLEENPVIKCIDGYLSIVTTNTNYSINLSDVLNYQFVDLETANVNEIPFKEQVEIKNGHVFLHLKRNGEKINIYSVSGLLIKSLTSTSDIIDIDISGFAKGQYVLKTQSVTCKFLKQ